MKNKLLFLLVLSFPAFIQAQTSIAEWGSINTVNTGLYPGTVERSSFGNTYGHISFAYTFAEGVDARGSIVATDAIPFFQPDAVLQGTSVAFSNANGSSTFLSGTDYTFDICPFVQSACYEPEDPFTFSGSYTDVGVYISQCPVDYLDFQWSSWTNSTGTDYCLPFADSGPTECPSGYTKNITLCNPDITNAECSTYATTQGWASFSLDSVGSNGAVECVEDEADPDPTGGGDFDDSGIIAAIEDQRDQQVAELQNIDSNLDDVNTNLAAANTSLVNISTGIDDVNSGIDDINNNLADLTEDVASNFVDDSFVASDSDIAAQLQQFEDDGLAGINLDGVTVDDTGIFEDFDTLFPDGTAACTDIDMSYKTYSAAITCNDMAPLRSTLEWVFGFLTFIYIARLALDATAK